ncbi:MAG: SH3 domain-containing protein [Winogradskyella sp.]|uniref:SH3 domain-containing protein n=1 Tax=Winogradskyella sp. TaxID=1883156 RepID=UPI00181169DB|nr:SH3 domain-containing protein [Winogradskyella sp.]MBT8245112.1 SH3 domain-containing protein [Winogradskyella sp.]NNK23593.1 SH3 domain-containing protein [Winogradskyella sp.]
MFLRILAVVCFAFSIAQAQDIQYVSAENGLVIREQPNQGATKIGILDYGTPVEITEYTDLALDVKDSNTKISGKWVKIKGPAVGEYFEDGYVFNGFLTEEKIERPLKIPFDLFTLYIDKFYTDVEPVMSEVEGLNQISKDDEATIFKVKTNNSPENRYLKVKHHEKYRAIKVFQRYKNNIAVTTKDGKTKLTDYQDYTSSWKPLELLFANDNIFKTMAYSDKDSKRFGDIDTAKLNAYLKTENGVSHKIVPSQIELKVVMTSIDGYKNEKNVIFELPLKD